MQNILQPLELRKQENDKRKNHERRIGKNDTRVCNYVHHMLCYEYGSELLGYK